MNDNPTGFSPNMEDPFVKGMLVSNQDTSIDFTDVAVPQQSRANKYDRGLNRYLNQESNRASNQTGWEARTNMAAQMASEVVFGTLEDIGYAFDAPQMAQMAGLMENTANDYSNWFSDIMKKGKEAVNEEFSVHGGEGFDPMNPRWWSKNGASLASSLSLLIPATGLAKGVGAIGKLGVKGLARTKMANGIVKNLNKEGTRDAITGINAAVWSRYLENTMEASGTYEEEIQKGIQSGLSKEDAEIKAGKAATNVWYANLVNIVPDLFQYSKLFGAGSKVMAQMAKDASKAGFKEGLKDVVQTMVSEGIEEGIQYGITKEASKSDNVFDVYKNMAQNASSYSDDPEFLNSVFLGAIGGGIFAGAGKALAKKVKSHEEYMGAIEEGNIVKQRELENEAILEATPEQVATVEEVLADEPEKLSKFKELRTNFSNRVDVYSKNLSKTLKDTKGGALEFLKGFGAELVNQGEFIAEQGAELADNAVDIAEKVKGLITNIATQKAKKDLQVEESYKITKEIEKELAPIKAEVAQHLPEDVDIKDVELALLKKEDNKRNIKDGKTPEEQDEIRQENIKKKKVKEAVADLKFLPKGEEMVKMVAAKSELKIKRDDAKAEREKLNTAEGMKELAEKKKKEEIKAENERVTNLPNDALLKETGNAAKKEIERRIEQENNSDKPTQSSYNTTAEFKDALKDYYEERPVTFTTETGFTNVDEYINTITDKTPVVEDEVIAAPEKTEEEVLNLAVSLDTPVRVIMYRDGDYFKTKHGSIEGKRSIHKNDMNFEKAMANQSSRIANINGKKYYIYAYSAGKVNGKNTYEYIIKEYNNESVIASDYVPELDTQFLESLKDTDWKDKVVKFKVKFNERFNSMYKKFEVHATIDGKVVGRLTVSNSDGTSYDRFRRKLHHEWVRNGSVDNYEFNLESKIDSLSAGVLNLTNVDNTPQAVLQDKPFILLVNVGNQSMSLKAKERADSSISTANVGTKASGKKNTGEISIEGNTLSVGTKKYNVKNPTAWMKAVNSAHQMTNNLAMLVENLAGEIVAVPIFAKKVRSSPKAKLKLLQAIIRKDLVAAQDIVKVKRNGKIYPNFNDKIESMTSQFPDGSSKLTFKRFNKSKQQWVDQIFNKEKTAGQAKARTFKDAFLHKGAYITIEDRIYNITRQDSQTLLIEVDANFNPIGNEINGDSMLSAAYEANSLGVHWAYKYYEYANLGDTSRRIKASDINQGNYNADVNADLKANYEVGKPFTGAEVKVKIPEVKSVKTTSLSEPKKFVTSQKRADREGGEFKRISEKQIDWKEGESYDNIRHITVLEQRGLNSDGIPVGTVQIALDSGEIFKEEVYFKTAPIKKTTTKSQPVTEKVVIKQTIPQNPSGIDILQSISDNFELTEDGSGYINQKTGEKYTRVSNFVGNTLPDNLSDKQKLLIKTAGEVGNNIDDVVRDIINGDNKGYQAYKEFFTTESVFNSLVADINSLVTSDLAKSRGERFFANNIIVADDTLKVAGELDIVTVDKNNVVRVYDIKNVRKLYPEGSEWRANRRGKWTKQQNVYRQFIEKSTGLKVAEINIVPIKTTYKAGIPITSTAKRLDTIPLTKVDIIKQITGNKPTGQTEAERKKAKMLAFLNRGKSKTKIAPKIPSQYKVWNQAEETAWFKKRFPNANLNVLASLKETGGNWGLFYQNTVDIYENAGEGTTYHESFHYVFNNISTNAEQNKILRQAKAKFSKEAYERKGKEIFGEGDIHKGTGKQFNPIEKEREILEELLADEFADYILARRTKGNFIHRLGTAIRRFFEKLFNLIDVTVNNRDSIERLFKSIEHNNLPKKYRTSNQVKTSRAKYNLRQNSGFSPEELKDAIDIGTYYTDVAIAEFKTKNPNATHKELEEALLGEDNIITDITNEKSAISLIQQLLPYTDENNVNPDLQRFMENLINFDTGKPDQLYFAILENLKTRGYAFKVDQLEEQSANETRGRESHTESMMEVDPLTRLSQELKAFFASVPQKDSEGNEIKGYLGLTKRHTIGFAWNKMMRGIGNTVNSTHMMEQLTSMINEHPIYQHFVDVLDKNPDIKTKVWNIVRNKPEFLSVLQDKVIPSNQNTHVKSVEQQLQSDYRNMKGISLADRAKGWAAIKTYVAAVERKGDELKSDNGSYKFGDKGIAYIEKLLANVGLVVSTDVLNRMNGTARMQRLINYFSKPLTSFGIDSFLKHDDLIAQNSSYFAEFSRTIAPNIKQQLQDTHRTPDGGTVFEWLNGNTIAKVINTLKDPKRGEELIRKYLQDPYFERLPLIRKLASGYGIKGYHGKYKKITPENLNWGVITEHSDGLKKASYDNMGDSQMIKSQLLLFASGRIPTPVNSDSGNFLTVKLDLTTGLTSSDKSERNLIDELAEFARLESEMSNNPLFGAGINTKEEALVRVNKAIDKMTASELASYKELGLLDEKGNLPDNIKGKNKTTENFVREFVTTYMNYYPQIGFLLNGEMSNYQKKTVNATVGNFYKRAKQNWSPKLYLDTNATYEGFKVRPHYNMLVVKDTEQQFQIDEIAKVYELDFNTKAEYNSWRKQFEKIEEADAQSYISPYRYKEQQVGLARWTPEMETEYQKIQNGEFSDMVFQPRKPFYYSMHLIDGKMRPIQNKDSEYMLSPWFGIKKLKSGKDNPMYNEVFKGHLELMGYTFTDTGFGFSEGDVMFSKITHGTAVKGWQPEYTEDITGRFSGEIIMNNEDWGLQMETPEHHIDSKGLFGTQPRKHMMSGLDLNNPKDVEWLKAYNEVIITDLKARYEKVLGKFNTLDDALELLRSEIRRRGDVHLLDGLELKNDGTTAVPVYHPVHVEKLENMLNSVFKKNVTNQKFKNSSTYVNLSSHGFDTPKIKFKANGEIDYVEAYVAPYAKWLNDYMDEDGIIDIERIEQELGDKALRGVFWRIPNEGNHFTFSIKVKGFLPQTSGGSIVLPPDLMVTAGFDFDIDKVFGTWYSTTKNEDGRTIVKSSLDTELGRQNQILDLMRQRLEIKDLSLFNTTNVIEIVKNNNVIESNQKDINFIDPASWRLISRNMASGKALVGVSANANVAHSVFQLAEKLVLESPFLFDGKAYGNLSPKQYIKKIAANLQSLLAAAVDNGKDPVLATTNFNTYTIGAAISMIMAGVDMRTVQFFMSNPAIKKLTNDYFNAGQNTSVEPRITRKFEPRQLTSKQLEESLNSNKISDIVDHFLTYKRMARPINEFIKAVKIGEEGMGATDEDNINKIDRFNSPEIDKISGARELLNRTDLFPATLVNVIKDGRQVLIDKVGLLAKDKGIFKSIRSKFKQYNNTIPVEQLKKINREVVNWFYSKPVKGADMIKTVKLLAEVKKETNDYNIFLNRLVPKKPVVGKGSYILGYKGKSGEGVDLTVDIKATWEIMLKSDNAKVKELAELLVQHSLWRSGFSITPDSFSHLIPSYYYEANIEDYKEQMEQENQESETVQSIFNQIIRNHYEQLTFIPTIKTDNENVKKVVSSVIPNKEKTGRFNVATSFMVVNPSSMSPFGHADAVQFIKQRSTKVDGKGKTKVYLYELVHEEIGESGKIEKAYYQIVQPLGETNNAVEYNKDFVNPKSVFGSNRNPIYNNSISRLIDTKVEPREDIDNSNPLRCDGNK